MRAWLNQHINLPDNAGGQLTAGKGHFFGCPESLCRQTGDGENISLLGQHESEQVPWTARGQGLLLTLATLRLPVSKSLAQATRVNLGAGRTEVLSSLGFQAGGSRREAGRNREGGQGGTPAFQHCAFFWELFILKWVSPSHFQSKFEFVS